MFGHQDDDSSQPDQNASNPSLVIPDEAANPAPEADTVPTTDSSAPVTTAPDPATPDPVTPDPVSTDDSTVSAATDNAADDQAWQHPGTPLSDPQPINDVISPAGGFPAPPTFPAASHSGSADDFKL